MQGRRCRREGKGANRSGRRAGTRPNARSFSHAALRMKESHPAPQHRPSAAATSQANRTLCLFGKSPRVCVARTGLHPLEHLVLRVCGKNDRLAVGVGQHEAECPACAGRAWHGCEGKVRSARWCARKEPPVWQASARAMRTRRTGAESKHSPRLESSDTSRTLHSSSSTTPDGLSRKPVKSFG